jgi:molybdopterin-containing oxidoreductase family membrane subunit
MFPVVGRFNWPMSMLTWDVIVLTGYLLINLHICGYLLYTRWLGRKPEKRWYVPFVFLSIFWAISIHTVTAFLYCGLGGRPFWNTALLAPRFLASAFVSGPAFLLIALEGARRLGGLKVGKRATSVLLNILRITLLINLLFFNDTATTEIYTGGSHTSAAIYLYFGLHGASGLVPWIWTSIALSLLGVLTLFWPGVEERPGLLITGSAAVFVAIWIEKGMGLIIPGFIPSTLHEVVEYAPSLVEWQITAGIWAFCMMLFTVALKIAIPIFKGEETIEVAAAEAAARAALPKPADVAPAADPVPAEAAATPDSAATTPATEPATTETPAADGN